MDSEVKGTEKLDRITIDPNVCLGQPTIRGMRITISVILKMLAGGKSIQEVLRAYPEMERKFKFRTGNPTSASLIIDEDLIKLQGEW